MKHYIRSISMLSLVVILVAVLGIYPKAQAASGPTGQYDILTFPGASATDCGSWAVYSSEGVTQPGPSNYVEKMTDGNGNVVFSRTSTGSTGTFTFWGSGGFSRQPEANPIHEHIVMDGVVIADIYANNPCLPAPVEYEFQGPPIPQGFVLLTITCNTPLYDMAGGSPLSTGEAVTAGQTWYVNPTPVVVGTTSWTEIFTSSYVNGYIPTSCVAG